MLDFAHASITCANVELIIYTAVWCHCLGRPGKLVGACIYAVMRGLSRFRGRLFLCGDFRFRHRCISGHFVVVAFPHLVLCTLTLHSHIMAPPIVVRLYRSPVAQDHPLLPSVIHIDPQASLARVQRNLYSPKRPAVFAGPRPVLTAPSSAPGRIAQRRPRAPSRSSDDDQTLHPAMTRRSCDTSWGGLRWTSG